MTLILLGKLPFLRKRFQSSIHASTAPDGLTSLLGLITIFSANDSKTILEHE